MDTEKTWSTSFGDEYTLRNVCSVDDMNASCKRLYGLTRSEINELFIGDIDRDSLVLEVGCNIGNQLHCLKLMGFNNLFGVDVNKKAIDIGCVRYPNINFRCCSGSKLPFPDGYFDLVFTSGVLIHVHPDCLLDVMNEMFRVSKSFIFGFEYFSKRLKSSVYRDGGVLVWRNDFIGLWMDNFPSLSLVKKKYINRNFRDKRVLYLLKNKLKQ